jgi:hypothetical protein
MLGLIILSDTHTFGMTPLDEGWARRRDLYLTAHDTNKRKISMPLTGFETAIPTNKQPQFQRLRQRSHRDRSEFYIFTAFI